MGLHYTKPSLAAVEACEIQKIISEHIFSWPLAEKKRVEWFAFEASRWVHSDGDRDKQAWQRGVSAFLTDRELGVMMSTSYQSWTAFHEPTFVYMASRAALSVWPQACKDHMDLVRQELATFDLRTAEKWIGVIGNALGLVSWAILGADVQKEITAKIHGKIEDHLYDPPLSHRIIHNVPTRNQQRMRLENIARRRCKEAVRLARQLVVATMLHRTQDLLSKESMNSGLFGAAARCLRTPMLSSTSSPRRHQTPTATGRNYGNMQSCFFSFAPTCAWDASYEVDEVVIPNWRRFAMPEPPDADDLASPWVAGVCLNSLCWRDVRSCSEARSFYRSADVNDALEKLYESLDALKTEFKTLWQKHNDSFLAWMEDGEVVDGWRLLGTRVLGARLEQNCKLAPHANSVAHDLGATFCSYSVLLPGTHIPPHAEDRHTSATRVHVPLTIPRSGACGLRVGKQIRVWTEGVPFAFDSTEEHEAWNFSDELRAVLLIDFGAAALPIPMWPAWLRDGLAGLIDASQFDRIEGESNDDEESASDDEEQHSF